MDEAKDEIIACQTHDSKFDKVLDLLKLEKRPKFACIILAPGSIAPRLGEMLKKDGPTKLPHLKFDIIKDGNDPNFNEFWRGKFNVAVVPTDVADQLNLYLDTLELVINLDVSSEGLVSNRLFFVTFLCLLFDNVVTTSNFILFISL